ncbi:copper-binding protein [Ramlibacter sp. USB13]|uniref:Copper-binding protein n=1 Tax=Ramlibacter cellulosilyticus TaxID=2764187 RepID=A0A923MRS9_9BURK|nr:copper-binding protein [Ramlibacter cellulosilyticus]MBC5784295.1 copper-binding protein [Ramlibacter cellulosilyticus]
MIRRISAALLALGLATAAFAQAAWTDAEVRKVDAKTGKITLKHGEIKNLDMPPMTMVFTAKDKALLEGVKAGDHVQFAADKDAAGEYVLTAIQQKK